jgi:hypothetical protein
MASKSDNIIQYNKKLVTKIFKQKKALHRQQARLPIEQKIKLLVQLQKIALTIRPKRGKKDRRVVWQLT